MTREEQWGAIDRMVCCSHPRSSEGLGSEIGPASQSRVISRFLILAVISLLLPGAVAASTLIPRTLEELSERAEVIVVGTVAEQEARFNDERTLILTHTTIDVQETIAGPPAAVLELSEYGGRVGQQGFAVPGMPRYKEGQQVLLFLCRDALGLLRTCGATQGRMLVRTLEDGSTRASGAMAGQPVDEPLELLRRRVLAAREEGGR
jgi:hypothetical protein